MSERMRKVDEAVRKMPSSVDAEQSVLGSMLIDDKCLPEVFQLLTADCFYVPAHREIFAAMTHIFERAGSGIDPVTLIEMLKENGSYDEATGREYIYNLSKSVPSAQNVRRYCEIVRDKFLLRRLIETCDDITGNCYLENGPVSDIIDSAEQKIYDINKTRQTGELVRLSAAIFGEMKNISEVASAEDKTQYTGLQTGYAELDRIVDGFGKGDLIILAARPGIGKTSFALNLMRNIAQKTKKECVIFSLEMSNSQLAQRIMSSEALIDSKKFRTGSLTDKEWIKLSDAAGLLHGCPILMDDKSGISIGEMKAKLRRVDNLGFVVIDYLQLLGSDRMVENRVLEISTFTRNLKILAKDLGVPVLVLSQLSRKSEERGASRPLLSDLRDSGSIEQDADVVMFLYYDKDKDGNVENPNMVTCSVAKNRHGMTGDVKLQFVKEFTRFSAIDTQHEEF